MRTNNYGKSLNFRGRVVLPFVYACMHDPRFRMLDELLARDEWSAEQIRAHQANRLERLFHIAWFHNAYWREKFQECGVNYRSGDPFTELGKLPVLTKDEVRKNYNRMRCTHLRDPEVMKICSGGSTGHQVSVWHTRYYQQLHTAMEYRTRSWMDVYPGDPYVSTTAVITHTSSFKGVLRSLRLMVDNGILIDAANMTPEAIRRLILRAVRHKPVHVCGYVSVLTTMARCSKEMGLQWPTVKAVSTTCEQLFDADRSLLREAFDATVYDRYGSREVPSIAMQCRKGSHHIYADLNYVEFAQVENADEGYEAILLTPLDNEAMPLFRYRNGDSASAMEGECACGSVLPLMTGCQGRICNSFVTPSGRIISGIYFYAFFMAKEGYRSFQFHQTAPDHIDLYVVPEGEPSVELRRLLDHVRERVAKDYDNQFEVTVHMVDEIPTTPSGKHLYILSDCLATV